MFRVYKTILWSNVPMALDAVGWTGLTFKILKIAPDYVLVVLTFALTWLFYTRDRIDISASDFINNPERSEWYAAQKFIKPSMFIATAVIILCLWLRLSILLPSLIALIPCFFYTKKIKMGQKDFSLKDLPGMKAVLVAFLWVVLTVFFPLFATPSVLTSEMTTIDFCFMVGLFVMLQIHTNDIRDIAGDRQQGTQSFAVMLGEKRARFLGLVLIGLGLYFGWSLCSTSGLVLFGILLVLRTLFYSPKKDIYWQSLISTQGLWAYFML